MACMELVEPPITVQKVYGMEWKGLSFSLFTYMDITWREAGMVWMGH